ncbi:MAG: nucleoside hydrolase [Anaerolineae bacterium]
MTAFPRLDPDTLLRRLEPAMAGASMVLDTDTYNEIDDQFALCYAVLADTLNLEAVYAAPFFNERSSGPADGMERSYQEILRVLKLLNAPWQGPVLRGSPGYLPAGKEPVVSPAAEDLVRRAMQPRNGPLYVLAIGAITNVASALLMAPEIVGRIVVVWLGGQPKYWPTAREFNLQQDVPAAQVVFDSGVPLVHIPCKNVAEHLRTTLPEIGAYVRGHGAIGDYLYRILEECTPNHLAYSRVIWDISTVAWMVNAAWVPTELIPSPVLLDDVTYGPVDPSRHLIRQAIDVNRDRVFGDLFTRLRR